LYTISSFIVFFFFSSRRRHTRSLRDWSSDVCSSDLHKPLGSWTLMFHGNAFLADVQQKGPRGSDKLFSVNWLMPMVSHDFGRQRSEERRVGKECRTRRAPHA